MDALREHIEQRLRNAQLELLPFPHLIVENFFPVDTYREMLQNNLFSTERGVEWISSERRKQLKTATPYELRLQINFSKAHDWTPFPDVARAIWSPIVDAFLTDDWFPKLVFKTFPEYFLIRFGAATNDDAFWSECRKQMFLQRHRSDYFIGPHTDIPTRIFTCIFSLADRPGFEDFGTQLLKPKDPKDRCWGCDHHDWSRFDLERMAPYRPNNCLLFFKTRQSFHAVKRITEDVPNQRLGMQFQFYEPGNGYFKDLSFPELMAARHDRRTLRSLVGSALRKLRGS